MRKIAGSWNESYEATGKWENWEYYNLLHSGFHRYAKKLLTVGKKYKFIFESFSSAEVSNIPRESYRESILYGILEEIYCEDIETCEMSFGISYIDYIGARYKDSPKVKKHIILPLNLIWGIYETLDDKAIVKIEGGNEWVDAVDAFDYAQKTIQSEIDFLEAELQTKRKKLEDLKTGVK